MHITLNYRLTIVLLTLKSIGTYLNLILQHMNAIFHIHVHIDILTILHTFY